MDIGFAAGRVLALGGRFHPHFFHHYSHYHSYGHGSGGGGWWTWVIVIVVVIAVIGFRFLRRR